MDLIGYLKLVCLNGFNWLPKYFRVDMIGYHVGDRQGYTGERV